MVGDAVSQVKDKWFARFSSNVVAGCFVVVLVVLVSAAAISTCFITFDDKGLFSGEFTFFVADSPLVNILAVVVFVAVAYAISVLPRFARFRNRLDDDKVFRKYKIILLCILLVVALAWLFLTLAIPGADQKKIQKAALLATQGDWSMFASGQYMSKHSHQIGFFWFSMPFAMVSGKMSSALVEGFNIFGLLISYELLSELSGRFGASRFQQLAVLASGIVFYPFIQFCSFVYGIIWGLAFALLAIKFEMHFFDTQRWRYALGAATCICVAMMLKSNYLIFFIAMALYALVELINAKAIRVVGLIAMMTVAFVVQSNLPVMAAEKASGYEIDHPCSSWSYIAMGMQDGPRAPGWYNKYNDKSYKWAGYDPAVQAEKNKDSIRKSLEAFASGERDGVRFFTQKIVSQWNNPTFQGYWNVQRSRPGVALQPFMQAFISARGVDVATKLYLNQLQFIILAGALIWIVLVPWSKPQFYRSLILPLVFVGGFLCHVLWEAKSQYAIQYFALLIPLAVMGYAQLVLKLKNLVARRKQAPVTDRNVEPWYKGRVVSLSILAVSVALVAAFGIAGYADCITSDAEEYQEWLDSEPVPSLVGRVSLIDLNDQDWDRIL